MVSTLYWIEVLNNIAIVAVAFLIIAIMTALISGMAFLAEKESLYPSEAAAERAKNFFKVGLWMFSISMLFVLFIPSKNTM